MRIAPLLRPAPGGGLPPGVKFTWIERPREMPGLGPADLPISAAPFGVVETDRDLTAAELDWFSLKVVEPVSVTVAVAGRSIGLTASQWAMMGDALAEAEGIRLHDANEALEEGDLEQAKADSARAKAFAALWRLLFDA